MHSEAVHSNLLSVTFSYLCLYFHLQYGSNYGQEIADNDQHIPAIQKLTLVILTHFTVVVLMQEPGESLKMHKKKKKSEFWRDSINKMPADCREVIISTCDTPIINEFKYFVLIATSGSEQPETK